MSDEQNDPGMWLIIAAFLAALVYTLSIPGCAHTAAIDCKRVCDQATESRHEPHTYAYHDEDDRRCYCVPTSGPFWTCPDTGCPQIEGWPLHQ